MIRILLVLLALAPLPAAAQRYTALLTESGQSHVVGVVNLDAAGQLSVVAAEPGQQEMLARIAAELNAEETLHLDAAPPASAPRFANSSIPVTRADPRFIAALRQQLERYYNVTIR